MSDPIDTDVSVYPMLVTMQQEDSQISYEYKPGMTLRDHFAGLAMVGAIMKHGIAIVPHNTQAVVAYQLADAMIATRKEQS